MTGIAVAFERKQPSEFANESLVVRTDVTETFCDVLRRDRPFVEERPRQCRLFYR